MGYPSDLSYPPRIAGDYVGCPDVEDKDAFAARVHGDSMKPKYRPGDVVIFSPAAKWTNGDDCFVRFHDGQTTFKRVFIEDGMVRLQPRNKKYAAQVFPLGQVTGAYKAVYKYQQV
jgi:phage repressor protein C with HTH and peptisase S24 domain